MLKKYGLMFLMLVMAASLMVGCGGKDDEDDENGDDDKPALVKFVPKGDEGNVAGVIKFDGEIPALGKIDMSQDPNCASAAGDKTVDDVVVEAGKLANAFVYLKDGPTTKFSFDTPGEPAVLDQQGCRYVPRILGMVTGQTLRVLNSDPTTHNVHPSPRLNQEWNKSQPPNAAPIEAKFNKAETLVPIKCNQHPWMKANVGVLAHPFFAVSVKDGTYSIKGVPPGSYTLVAWHEKFGEQQQKVTVGANQSLTQDFTYSAKKAYAATSLRVEPAVVLP